MQARDRYPVDTVTGGCFVSQRYELEPGEMICDLDCDLEALPAWGRLCVSEKGVRMMATCLDLPIVDRKEIEAAQQLIHVLSAENVRLRKAMAAVFDARALAALDNWMEESVS